MTVPENFAAFLKKYEAAILAKWLEQQSARAGGTGNLMAPQQAVEQSTRFLNLLTLALSKSADPKSEHFAEVRETLAELGRTRARFGFNPIEVATFVFSLKKSIFATLQLELKNDPSTLATTLWQTTELLDELGLYTIELYQEGREQVIARQQQEMMELSTPVVKLWDGILALPLIGTLDSARTQVVMESLLEKIVSTGSDIAIIDITGVPTVDTLVAQHLMKTVAAARLMGADCIISGIRPQIAQTIVHLGVELQDITTKATMAAAFSTALARTGQVVGKRKPVDITQQNNNQV